MASTDVLSNFQRIMEGISEAGDSDLFAGSLKSLQKLDKTLQNQQKLVEEASKKGRWAEVASLIKIADESSAKQNELTNQIVKAQEKLKQLQVDQDQKGIKAQLKHIGTLNQQMITLSDRTQKQQQNTIKITKNLEKNVREYGRVLEQREEKYAELGKLGAMYEEKLGNRLEGVVDTFTGGISDIDNIGKNLLKGMTKFGGMASVVAGGLKAKGEKKGDSDMVGLGDLLGKVGKFAKTLAVIGGSVMALVALFKFVEGTIIESNKKLVEGTGLIDLMAAGGSNVSKSLDKIRDTFNDSNFANAMGIPLKDTLALVGSFEQLNMGIKQFGGGTEAMERMKEAMKSAKGFSIGLGISMDEASQYMSRFKGELGVSVKDGALLGRMADEFANIRDMALQSGYQTANFFKKVTDLTGSLENMNYRTEEAGSLILRFGKVLGKSGLDAALQQLFTGFRGEGYLDQLKRNMLSKSEELQAATKVEAIRFGKTFLKFFGDPDKENPVGGQVESLLKAIGGDSLDQVKDAQDKGKKLMEVVGNLDETQRQDVMAKLLKDKSVTDGMRAELYKFMRIARGSREGATQAEKQMAQEEMGATGNLRSRAAIISSVIGDKDVNKLGVVDKAALESFGISKEQLDTFAQLQTGFKGQFREIQKLASDKTLTDQQKKDQIAAMNAGVVLNEKGQLIMKDTGEAVKSFSAFLQAQGESLDKKLDTAEGPKTQEQYLDEGVRATTSVFDVLNNTIAAILNDISKGIYGLFTFFSGESGDEKADKAELVKDLTASIDGLMKEAKTEDSAIRKEEKRLTALSFKKGLSPEQTKQMEKDKKALEVRKQKLEEFNAETERRREQLREIQSSTYSGAILDYEKENILEEAGEAVLERRKRTGSEKGELGKFQAQQKEDLAGLEEIIGGTTYKALRDYVSAGGMDEKVVQRMAEKGLTLEKSTDGRGGYSRTLKRKGETVSKFTQEAGRTAGQGEYIEGMTIESNKEAKMTQKALEELKKLPKAQRDKESLEDQKARKKENIAQQKEAFKQASKENKEEEMKAIAKALGIKGNATSQSIVDAYKGTDAQKKKLMGLSVGGNTLSQNLLGLEPTGDVLLTEKGNYKLDRKDQYIPLMREGYAFAKPGGVMDRAGGLGGGGGGTNVTFNIYDARNADLVSQQVMNKIKQVDAMTSGGGR